MISFSSLKQISCLCLTCLLLIQCENNVKKTEGNIPAVQSNTTSSIKIAYVNSDTVSKYYDFAALIQTKLLNKRSSAENQLKDKMSSYQKLRADFEKAAPIMGEREKMEKAQNIMTLEQEIMRVEQDLTDQLAQEELLLAAPSFGTCVGRRGQTSPPLRRNHRFPRNSGDPQYTRRQLAIRTSKAR